MKHWAYVIVALGLALTFVLFPAAMLNQATPPPDPLTIDDLLLSDEEMKQLEMMEEETEEMRQEMEEFRRDLEDLYELKKLQNSGKIRSA